jgi:hypothetical protein
MRAQFQGASLKVAREELAKAIAIIDRTQWDSRCNEVASVARSVC